MKRWTIGPAVMAGAAIGGALVKRLWLEKYRQQKAQLNYAERERDLFHDWLLLEQRGIRVSEYFEGHSYNSVAVFGMGCIGRCFVDALGAAAVYGVEQDNLAAVHERLAVYRLGDDPLPLADCMVICDLERVVEKQAAAGKEFSGDVITLPEVLTWLLERHHISPPEGTVGNWMTPNTRTK